MEEFDVEQADSRISLDEFKAGISKWLDDLRQETPAYGAANPDMMMEFLIDIHQVSCWTEKETYSNIFSYTTKP